MPDDIVAQLLQRADTAGGQGETRRIMREAAAEIEELRSELDHERRLGQHLRDALLHIERMWVQCLNDQAADVEKAADE